MVSHIIIPETTTPAELAERLGASPRRVQDEVRALGCYCKIGGKVLMCAHHVEAFMEAMECPSNSTGAAKPGTTGDRLPEGDYVVLRKRLTKPMLKGSKRKLNKGPGTVVSMAQGPG